MGTTAPTSAPAPTPASAPAPNPVTTQVVDRIAALVTSAGTNGEAHRVTLKLQPEALGDVRVVLTVRDGVTHVQLSAHESAARTLAADASELNRMLDRLGVTDARVSVRDLGAGSLPAPAQTNQTSQATHTSQAGQPAHPDTPMGSDGSRQQANDFTDRNNDRARTPGRSTATDGTDVVTKSSQPTQSVGSHRSPGVDLTM